MKHLPTTEIRRAMADELPALEYVVHSLWALALGLPHLIRNADSSEVEAARSEAIEAANMILSAFGEKQ